MKKLLKLIGFAFITAQCFADNGQPINITKLSLSGTISSNTLASQTSKQYNISLPESNVKYALLLVEVKGEESDMSNWGRVIMNNNLYNNSSHKNNFPQLDSQKLNGYDSEPINDFNKNFSEMLGGKSITTNIVALFPF